mmetsp:Transcript_26236/g.55657  ORF Transcript_26236/g.55657 Transcript_26236/m.55657 type:complete len:374 (-) Transcript_26236:72-1193(-)
MSNSVEEIDGEGGFRKLRLTRASGASCEVYIYAAHITSWKTADGNERLFMSSGAEFVKGKSLRGGVPICWPQFAGRGPYGKHGFARNTDAWKVRRTAKDPPTATLELRDCAESADWPFSFVLKYTVTLDSDYSLSINMEVSNMSDDPLDFTTALHSYFVVSDVGAVKVSGLKGLSFEDNAAGGAVSAQADDELAIAGEVDRVYLDTADVLLTDGASKLTVQKHGFPDAVVWNIGEAKAGSIKDLGSGEWRRYVCIEAAAIANKVVVEPGASWSGEQKFLAVKCVSEKKMELDEDAEADDSERLGEVEKAFKAKAGEAGNLTLERAYKVMFSDEEKELYPWKDFQGDIDGFASKMQSKEHLTWEEAKLFLETYG